MMKLESKVMDSWAMVAWAQDEPAASAVESFLQDAEANKIRLLMSAMSVGETFYILAKRRSLTLAEEFSARLPSLPVEVIVPDIDGVLAAACINATRPVAYGDSFVIALAQSENASNIAGDDTEIQSSGLVPLDWVGQA